MLESIQRCSFGVGDSIDGKYQVEKVLGEGTFGIVYSVRDYQGNKYALKLLRLWEVHPEIRDGLMKRFDMEFETGQIESDYLVHSIDHGVTMGNPYIVMELCTGGDVVTLSEHSKLNLSKIAIHVLKGLGALHACGKVHRDLKPENVLLKANGNFALTDFGISGDRNNRMTQTDIFGRSAQIFGTYAYMPPEQLNRKKNATVLPTTDIFSFGVMMYQLVTNVLPFGNLDDEGDLIDYIKRGKNGDWDRNALRRSKDGSDWEPLIEGCLQPRFQERFQTVSEVLNYVPEMPYEPPKEREPEKLAEPFQTKIVNGVLLRIMQGDDYGKVYYLDNLLKADKSILTVGRKDESVENDISITENSSSYVSRKHCTLELDYNIGSWIIRDGQWDRFNTGGWKRSTNGTFVNSTEVDRTGIVFKPGDIISIGDTKLRAEGY